MAIFNSYVSLPEGRCAYDLMCMRKHQKVTMIPRRSNLFAPWLWCCWGNSLRLAGPVAQYDGFWWILILSFRGKPSQMALIFGYLWLLGNACEAQAFEPGKCWKWSHQRTTGETSSASCSNHIVHRLVTDCILKAGAPWGPASIHLAKESSVFSRHDKKP